MIEAFNFQFKQSRNLVCVNDISRNLISPIVQQRNGKYRICQFVPRKPCDYLAISERKRERERGETFIAARYIAGHC